jgi:hypothetical protein
MVPVPTRTFENLTPWICYSFRWTAMSNAFELAGRKALVTGGTKGIDAAVTTRLREAGAQVLIIARAPPDDLASPELVVPSISNP